MTQDIPIEDFFEDIIAKSMRGRHVSEADLAARTGVDRDTLGRLCRGELCDEGALGKVALALDLDPTALLVSASRAWRPRPVTLEGLAVFTTPYRDMLVNAFLLWDPATGEAAAFDTGTDCSGMLELAREKDLAIDQIFLTHMHNDHIADLDRLRAESGAAVVRSNRAEPFPGSETFSEGAEFGIGSLAVKTLTTSGHSAGGTTYVVTGLERGVAVVGDSIFAGSMGGGMVSFADAWKNNREKTLTLPEDTVICPGHGPLSSVGEERRNNPFFAGEFR